MEEKRLSLLCALAAFTSCVSACGEGKFQCTSGQCIPGNWKCDGERDCLDGTDEWTFACSQELIPQIVLCLCLVQRLNPSLYCMLYS